MRLTARGPIANPCRCAGACGLTVLLAVIALGCSQATDPGSDAVLSTPSSPPAGAGSDPALDDFIQAKMDKAHYPGAVCGIVKDGRIVFAGAYGWADIEKRVPMATDAIIGLASVSKTVLATAAMECVERGTLSLDDDIDRTLGYTVRNPKHPDVPVTPRMLMTHTSSIKDRWEILDSLVNWGSDSSIPLDDFVRGYTTPGGAYWTAKNWGEYRPGSRYSYTNAGACGTCPPTDWPCPTSGKPATCPRSSTGTPTTPTGWPTRRRAHPGSGDDRSDAHPAGPESRQDPRALLARPGAGRPRAVGPQRRRLRHQQRAVDGSRHRRGSDPSRQRQPGFEGGGSGVQRHPRAALREGRRERP